MTSPRLFPFFFLLALSLRLLEVSLLSRIHSYVWFDALRSSSTTVWSMKRLVVFVDSVMRRGLLQEPPALNHLEHFLAASSRHGQYCYCPSHHYPHMVLTLLVLLRLPRLLVLVRMTVRVATGLFFCLPSSWFKMLVEEVALRR